MAETEPYYPRQPNHFLVTIDTCASNRFNYELLNQLIHVQKIAYADGLAPESQIVLAVPSQIIREQANIYNHVLVNHLINSKGKGVFPENYDERGLIKYWRQRVSDPQNGIFSVDTGYCKSFSQRIARKVLPEFLEPLLDSESQLKRKSRHLLIHPVDKQEQAETKAYLKSLNHKDSTIGRNIEIVRQCFSALYTQISDMMHIVGEPGAESFKARPSIANHLNSPSVSQVLRNNNIWPVRFTQVMEQAHRDCGDYAILQLYTNYLPEKFSNHQWVHIVVSRDNGLLNHLSEFFMNEGTRNIRHSVYPRVKKKHSLHERPDHIGLLAMSPYEFYGFMLRRLEDITGIEFEFKNDKSAILRNEQRVDNWGNNQSAELVAAVKAMVKKLGQYAPVAEKSQMTPRNNSPLQKTFEFTRAYISSGAIPDRPSRSR